MWMNGALFDITERRAAEEALRRREIEAARTEELRASRARIVAAADAARRKLERDLHDGAQQRLVSMALDVRVARRRREDPTSAGPFLDRLARGARRRDLRAARARPRHPSGRADRPRAGAGRRGARRALRVPVELVGLPPERLPPTAEITAYFTVSEALANVAKYARGHARHRPARARRQRPRGRGARRRRRRRAGDAGLRPQRPRRPRRRDATGRSRWSARRARARWCAR